MANIDVVLRWFMVVLFSAFGAWLLANRRCIGNVRGFFVLTFDEGSTDERICAALQKRTQLDRNVGLAGIVSGVCALQFALLAASTTVSVTLLYGVFVLIYAVTLTVRYLTARHCEPRRAASLEARRSTRAMPWYVYGSGFIVALLPLLYIDRRRDAVAALVVTATALIIVGLAMSAASAPARIGDGDRDVERFIDTRLRSVRALHMLALESGVVYVFVSFTGFTDSVEHVSAFLLSLATFAVLFVAMHKLRRRPPSADEVSRWRLEGV